MATDLSFQQRIEAAVRSGRDVQKNVAALVAAAMQQALAAAGDIAEVVRTTIAGASRAVEAALPPDRPGTLRRVVDGIGDGIGTAAHAAELTLREAGSGAARFARADLQRLAEAFGSMSARFADGVAEGATRAGGHAAAGARELREHALATLRRIEPLLASAIDAARHDPIGLGRETMTAGVAATRGAAGALFTALGKRLENLGGALDPGPDAAP